MSLNHFTFVQTSFYMSRSRTTLFLIIFILLIPVFHSCDVMQQASQLRALTRCEFKLENVTGLELAGVDIQEVESLQDLSLSEYAKITTAFIGGSVPLDFDLNVAVLNPNKTTAAMNEMDWILYIDDIEVTKGRFDQRIVIPGNGGTEIFPIALTIDLLEVLSGDSRDAVLNFAFNLAGNSERPTQLMLKAKPTIYVGNNSIEYPGYIKIRTEFTSAGF